MGKITLQSTFSIIVFVGASIHIFAAFAAVFLLIPTSNQKANSEEVITRSRRSPSDENNSSYSLENNTLSHPTPLPPLNQISKIDYENGVDESAEDYQTGAYQAQGAIPPEGWPKNQSILEFNNLDICGSGNHCH
jgi:hypothetical protein